MSDELVAMNNGDDRGGKAMISLSPEAQRELAYARREAPKRGGYIWEGARTAMGGLPGDRVLGELLAAGLLVPHEDPTKGWIPVPASKPAKT